jgi:hypothetical protein
VTLPISADTPRISVGSLFTKDQTRKAREAQEAAAAMLADECRRIERSEKRKAKDAEEAKLRKARERSDRLIAESENRHRSDRHHVAYARLTADAIRCGPRDSEGTLGAFNDQYDHALRALKPRDEGAGGGAVANMCRKCVVPREAKNAKAA